MRQLSAADRGLLEAHIQVESISAGTQLAAIGEPVDSIYFPVDTLISVEQAGGLEVAMVGREGMFGWNFMASPQLLPFRAVICGRGGHLLKIPAAAVVAAFAASPPFRAMLCQYLFVLAVQMGESMAAHGLCQLEARVARWILIRHDRVGGDEIRTQHSQIAANLGARRASITDCLHIIEGHSDVRCRRGRILVRDRASLEQRASGCYGLAEAQYRNSFGSFGKSLRLNPGSSGLPGTREPAVVGSCIAESLLRNTKQDRKPLW